MHLPKIQADANTVEEVGNIMFAMVNETNGDGE
jgi:hypothetical protein